MNKHKKAFALMISLCELFGNRDDSIWRKFW